MDILANALVALVGGEKVKTGHISLYIRKRFADAEADREALKRYPEVDPKLAYLRKMAGLDREETWQGAGVMMLLDTRSGIAVRVRYHGPSLDEIGEIRLVARLAFKAYGREVVVDTKESPFPIPMEMEIYQLDPENQRIWLVNEDLTDAKLVWPEPGVDLFPDRVEVLP